MPYIHRGTKDELETRSPTNTGELNYCITRVLIDYYGIYRNYKSINDIMGALEAAKAEFYRRIVVPYEDQKIKDNGDVYE